MMDFEKINKLRKDREFARATLDALEAEYWENLKELQNIFEAFAETQKKINDINIELFDVGFGADINMKKFMEGLSGDDMEIEMDIYFYDIEEEEEDDEGEDDE